MFGLVTIFFGLVAIFGVSWKKATSMAGGAFTVGAIAIAAAISLPATAQAAPYGYYYYGSYGSYDYFNGYGHSRSRRSYRKRRARRASIRPGNIRPRNRFRKAAPRRSAYKPAKVVPFDKKYKKGTIVVDTSDRKLFYVLRNGSALRYTVAVGKPGMQWYGKTFVQLKRKNPGWTPTARMRREGAPAYVPPGPKNPLGVRAINLGWTEYRIHGTNSPNSIGRAASSGCIRMRNSDVKDLFDRVHIGAPVYVIR